MNEIINIKGIDCYEKDGTAYLKLETVARGLGFTDNSKGAEYVRWSTVRQYLSEIGFSQEVAKDDFIPENIFYRLAMKAKNEAAETFQAKIADEVIPSIRKHGGYIAGQEALSPAELMARALKVAEQTLADREARISALEVSNSALSVDNQVMRPKADYFDELVDRNLLTNFRDTAKQLGVQQKAFIAFLLEKKYIYRDKKGNLMPYAEKNNGLFEVKECFNEKTKWGGVL